VLGALQGKPGVKSVQVDVPSKKVYLDYDESALSLDLVGEILDEEGYPVESTQEGVAPANKRGFIPLFGK
jgi:copper chaperone CopZ